MNARLRFLRTRQRSHERHWGQGPDITSHVTVQIKMTDRGQRRGWPERSPAMTEGEPFFLSAGTTTARSQTRNPTGMGPARNTDTAYNNKAVHNSKAATATGFTQLAMAIIVC